MALSSKQKFMVLDLIKSGSRESVGNKHTQMSLATLIRQGYAKAIESGIVPTKKAIDFGWKDLARFSKEVHTAHGEKIPSHLENVYKEKLLALSQWKR